MMLAMEIAQITHRLAYLNRHAHALLGGVAVVCAVLCLPVSAHAVFDTPPADVFGAEAEIERNTGHGLRPNDCPDVPTVGTKINIIEVINITLCHNIQTRVSWFQLRSQAVGLNQTKVGQLLPNVSVNAGLNQNYTRADSRTDVVASSSAAASLSYTLFDFGVREATIESAEQSLQAAMTSYDSSLQGLIANTLSSYYQLLSSQYSLQATEDSLLFARRSMEAAQARFELGLVAKSDVLQAEASYAQTLLGLEQARNAVEQGYQSLAVTMGVDPATEFEIADIDESALAKDDLDVRVQELVDIALANRKDLKSAEQSLESSLASFEATKRSNLPTVSLSASQSYSDIDILNRDTPRTGALGFSVSIPIFSGFTRSYTIKSSELGIKSQRLGIQQTKLEIARDVRRAYQNYKTAEQSWLVSFDSLNSTAELRDIALGRYKEGVGSLLSLESAQSSYSSAQSSYINARFSLLSSRVDLIRAVGVLNKDNALPSAASLARLP